MYQAIVFLPLLGAIIAGLIAIAGAHQRHPGGEPGEHVEADHHAPAKVHALAVKETEAEDDAEAVPHAAAHPPPDPAARRAEFITSGFPLVPPLPRGSSSFTFA